MLKHLNYTVVLTFISLSFAITGISFTFDNVGQTVIRPVWWAVICLLASGFCDAFDGRIARSKKNRTLSEIRFGIQLDSLCDIVCFGVLPCCIGYAIGMNHWIYIPFFCFYCICGVIRLSYFNMKEEEELISDHPTEEKTYTGMPITTVALIFPLFYMVSHVCAKAIGHFAVPVIFSTAFVMSGILFVTPVKFKKPGLVGVMWMVAAGFVEAVVIISLLLLKRYVF